MDVADFVAKWRKASLQNEMQVYADHLDDLCRLANHPTRLEYDTTGERFAVQKSVTKLGGGPAPRERKVSEASGGGGSAALVKGGVAAQIAGRILSIKVKVGDTVAKGDVLLLLEAMKMENEIKSPTDGIVKDIPVKEGDRVSEGQVLAVVEID